MAPIPVSYLPEGTCGLCQAIGGECFAVDGTLHVCSDCLLVLARTRADAQGPPRPKKSRSRRNGSKPAAESVPEAEPVAAESLNFCTPTTTGR